MHRKLFSLLYIQLNILLTAFNAINWTGYQPSGIENMLELAQSEQQLAVDVNAFYITNKILCVKNGCLDFNTMSFSANKPEDMNIRLALVTFDPMATILYGIVFWMILQDYVVADQ